MLRDTTVRILMIAIVIVASACGPREKEPNEMLVEEPARAEEGGSTESSADVATPHDAPAAPQGPAPGDAPASGVPGETPPASEAEPVESGSKETVASQRPSEPVSTTTKTEAAPRAEAPGEPTAPAAGTGTREETAVLVPDQPVRVEPAKAGLEYVGAEKCGKCHRLQLTSWRQTEHAALEHPLDCEGCHGPGSEYQAIKVMRDPEAARDAGLVDPKPEFCLRCHTGAWEDGMLEKAHAHKREGS